MRAYVLVTATVLVAAGCGGRGGDGEEGAPVEGPGPTASVTSPDALVGTWELVVIDVEGDEEVTPVAEAVPTITFSAEATPTGSRSLQGFAGCNQFMGSYDAGTTGRFTTAQPLAMTRMMCSEERMQVEDLLAMALGAARAYAVEGDTLTLDFEGGTLRFRQPPAGEGGD